MKEHTAKLFQKPETHGSVSFCATWHIILTERIGSGISQLLAACCSHSQGGEDILHLLFWLMWPGALKRCFFRKVAMLEWWGQSDFWYVSYIICIQMCETFRLKTKISYTKDTLGGPIYLLRQYFCNYLPFVIILYASLQNSWKAVQGLIHILQITKIL